MLKNAHAKPGIKSSQVFAKEHNTHMKKNNKIKKVGKHITSETYQLTFEWLRSMLTEERNN